MAGETLSVNCSDSSGHTPLHEACLVGQREMVELFLRHGAQLEIIAPENDQSPLHVACQYNHKDVRKERSYGWGQGCEEEVGLWAGLCSIRKLPNTSHSAGPPSVSEILDGISSIRWHMCYGFF